MGNIMTNPTHNFYGEIDFEYDVRPVTPQSKTLRSINTIIKECEEYISQGLVKSSKDTVPSAILHKKEWQIELENFRVDCGRISDDEIYMNNLKLIDLIPRGMCLMKLTKGDNTYYDMVTYATRKFTGFNDNDIDTQRPIDYSLSINMLMDIPKLNTIVSMEKINGSAVNFSGRYIGDVFYLFVGSKNVRILVNPYEDINVSLSAYKNDLRYTIPKKAAQLFINTWLQLNAEKQTKLAKWLHSTRGTIVGEICLTSDQHIVLKYIDELYLFGITPPPSSDGFYRSYTLLDPLKTLEVFRSYGFKTPNYVEYTPWNEIYEDVYDMKTKRQTEGVVLYCMDLSDNVTNMIKLKTTWYILLRAIREKTKYHFHRRQIKNTPVRVIDTKIVKEDMRNRIRELTSYVSMPPDEMNEWLNKISDWVDFYVTYSNEHKIGNVKMIATFPKIWSDFIYNRRLEGLI
ncbi:ferredoxin [Macrobrachium rosenbergii nudivirus]|nr:ferredoxin [Macrobrachium rosenbergii nudivirus]